MPLTPCAAYVKKMPRYNAPMDGHIENMFGHAHRLYTRMENVVYEMKEKRCQRSVSTCTAFSQVNPYLLWVRNQRNKHE